MSALARQLQLEAGMHGAGSFASDDGAVVLLRHRFDATEGDMGQPGQLRLGLLLRGGGRLYQRTAAATLQAHWLPGQFNVVLPGDHGSYASPSLELLGLAIDTHRLLQDPAALGDLQPLAARLHRDPVIASVLQALWCTAQADACLPGFLQQGAQVVLQRLRQLSTQAPAARRQPTAPLSASRLQRLQDYIDQQRAQPLDVAALAAAVQMEVSTFSRALQAATGITPYAFLTRQRMHWAQQALHSGHSVTEVALACGYANPGKFAAAFRRVAGCTPSAWAAAGGPGRGH